MDLDGGEGNERLILNQIAEKDMKVKLDSQTVFTGKDDMMTMTVTVFTDAGEVTGNKKYIRHHIHQSHDTSGTTSPNGHKANGRPNGLLADKKDASRKLSAPF